MNQYIYLRKYQLVTQVNVCSKDRCCNSLEQRDHCSGVKTEGWLEKAFLFSVSGLASWG